MTSDRLADLDHGFRRDYLDYHQRVDQLQAWAQSFPDLARLEVIGRTDQG